MNFICCLHSCDYFVSLRISNPNWGFEEITVMWFLLKFPLTFFCTNHILIRFLLFWIIFIEDTFEWFLYSFCSTCKNLNCTLLHLFYVEPMLGYETYFVAVIFITGFYTNAIFWSTVFCGILMNENSLILHFDVDCFDVILTF